MSSLYQALEHNQNMLHGSRLSLSLRDACSYAEKLAGILTELEISTLALYAENSPEWLVVDLACQIADVCLIPIPTFFSRQQIQHCLDQAACFHLLTDQPQTLADRISQIEYMETETITSFSLLYRRATDEAANMPQGTGKITFTSGSTGEPKGVCLSHTSQAQVAQSLGQMVNMPNTRHLCLLPLSTLLENVAGAYTAMLGNSDLYLPDSHELGFSGTHLNMEKLLNSIEHYQPNTLILVPELLKTLISACSNGWQPPSSLQFIAVGGGKVAAESIYQARAFGLPVYEGYGLSECCSVVSLNTPAHDQPGSAGCLLPHLTSTVIDDELCIAGNPFLGYLNEPASWHPQQVCTGDLGRLDNNHYLHIHGRSKNLLISSFGRNISPEWVESTLMMHSPLQQAVVVGDKQPFCSALIFADSHISDADIQQMINHSNEQLPAYAQLKRWRRLPEKMTFSKGLWTANGRPKRQAINQHYQHIIEQIYTSSKEELTMNFFDQLSQANREERNYLLSSPIIQKALSQTITLEEYVAFLTQAYHHVKHTVPLLMAVGARIPEQQEWLREAIAEYIEEELGHQEWILNDIAACGFDKEKARNSQPNMATEMMVAYAYDMINRVNPLGFFGMVHVLEGTSVNIADQAAEQIQQALDLPNRAFTYLRSHGSLDQEHVKFFEELMNRIHKPEDQTIILHAAKRFYCLYADIFRTLEAEAVNRIKLAA